MFKKILITAAMLVSATTATMANPAWTTGAINFRDGPGTYYAKLGSISSCVKVETDYQQNGWYRVSWNGRWGWVSARYLSWNGNHCNYAAPQTYHAPTYKAPAYSGY